MNKLTTNSYIPQILNINQLQTLAESILHQALRHGATQAEVSIDGNKGFSVTARNGDVETVEHHNDKLIDISVYFGQRSGSASISDMRPEAVTAAVKAACHIAKFTDADPALGLAEKEELAFTYPTLNLAQHWSMTVEQAIDLACQCEKEALSYDKRIVSAEAVGVTTSEMLHLYANSQGFMGFYPHSSHEISCILIARQGEDMQRDYSYTTAVDPSLLESFQYVAHTAAKRTVQRLGAKRLSTRKAPVIFVAEEARGLLRHFAQAVQGGNLYRKSSFLIDHLGKQIFPAFVQLQEQPHLPLAAGSVPFDSEGVATRPNIFIENGVLTNYALGVYSARKLGMKSTGNAGGMHNLILKPGEKDLADLIKMMDRGLLVTETMGQGVNLVTGDYSRGAGGYWIEHGEIQYPVQEVTIAGRLQDMFLRFREAGKDVDVRGNIRTGSILIDEMTIAGTS